MSLDEYHKLPPMDRVAIAKQQATAAGLQPAAVYAYLENTKEPGSDNKYKVCTTAQ